MKNLQKASKMRTYSKWIVVVLIMSFNSLNAKNLQANFQYFTYQNDEGLTYIETFISFLSTEINYQKTSENNFQGSVLVEMSIKNGNEIYFFDKYIFQSPLISDTLTPQNFIDKQIIALKNGEYTLELKLTDVISNHEISASTPIKINYQHNSLSLSDVMILDSYQLSTQNSSLSKSGYDLLPLNTKGSYFFDDDIHSLNFYIEWYNTHTDTATNQGYLLNYYIENDQTHVPLTGFNAIKKKTTEHAKAHLGGFDITLLASGNYNLVISIMDRKGKGLINKRIFFQRRNSTTSLKPQDYASLNSKGTFVDDFTIIEELAENISSLLPIATQREWSYASNQLKTWDLTQMKQFFYGFWENRSPLDPQSEWIKYYDAVKRANQMFSCNKIKGFATDRGRIYLKYGTANYIENSVHENHMLPYQIWSFTKIGTQTNRLFIFAETAMGTNDYELIHSTVQGELYNENWKDIVYRVKYDVYKRSDIDFDKNNSIIDTDFNTTRDENDNIIKID